MEIVFHTVEKGGEHSIAHDLNFQKETYDAKHTLVSSPGGSHQSILDSYFVL
jgi:transcription initiation factor IIF auxiliary subunit